MKPLIKFVAIILLSFSCSVPAYKEVTHEDLTQSAYNNSFLKTDQTLYENLGIQNDEILESATLSKLNIKKGRLKIPLYIMRSGATFEDEGGRPLNHFFDPYHEAYDTINHTGGFISPKWSLEFIGSQDYSYHFARKYLFDALIATTDDERDQNFSNLFRSLGHIVHHVQDMAQPQHVRKDSHLEIDYLLPDFLHLEDPSLYEKYTAGVSEGVTDDDAVDAHLQAQLSAQFNGYAPVIFNNARDYWHTEGEDSYNGEGLAEFTNREFVSKDTNFGMPDAKDYLSPDIDNATPFTIADVSTIFTAYGMSVPALCQGSENPCAMKFYSMQVTDNLRSEKSGQNSFATTESIFNQDVDGYNSETENPQCELNLNVPCGARKLEARFTLNKLNFWSGYPFLLSRAVGYSSGLLNYFFRGRLKAKEADFIGNEASFFLENAIDSEAYPKWSNEYLHSGGELVVSFRYRHNGVEYRGVSNIVILTQDLYPGESTTEKLFFNYNTPEGAFIYDERIVYKGQIGEQGAVDFNAVAFGSFQPISVLFALVGDVESYSTDPTNDKRTLSVLRSRDSGRTWEVVLDKFYSNVPNGYAGHVGITSEGTQKLRVIYETTSPCRQCSEVRSLQLCTNNAGVDWYDCSITTLRKNNPRPNESTVFNTGSSFMSRQLDVSLPSPGTRAQITYDQGETWLETGFTYREGTTLYPKAFRRYPTGEVSFLLRGPLDCAEGNGLHVCTSDQQKLLSEFKSYPGGIVFRRVRNGIAPDELKFYSNSLYFHAAADWEDMLDIGRYLIFIRDGESPSDKITEIRFTDDNGVTDFPGVSAGQFSKKNSNSRFAESAYLGNGRMILRLDEFYSSKRASNAVGNRLLLSEDYGLTWESVNSLNIEGTDGELDRFNIATRHGLSGMIGIEAVALTPEGLYVIK